MDEPRWIPTLAIEVIHLDQVREHGGFSGLRDRGALESALARPRNKWIYENATDLADLAAAYGYGLARSHPFNDGNKRVAFLAVVVFIELNGAQLDVSERDVVSTILALAAGELTESAFAAWIRAHLIHP